MIRPIFLVIYSPVRSFDGYQSDDRFFENFTFLKDLFFDKKKF